MRTKFIYHIFVNAFKYEVILMCEMAKEKSKSEIITALIDHNVFKMPDGRQFYEASENELKSILYTHSDIKHIC